MFSYIQVIAGFSRSQFLIYIYLASLIEAILRIIRTLEVFKIKEAVPTGGQRVVLPISKVAIVLEKMMGVDDCTGRDVLITEWDYTITLGM